jgi:N-dimethylarginine dimethylaminohydrolase
MFRTQEQADIQKKPVFGMRAKKLNKQSLGNPEEKEYSSRLASQLIVYYQHALLKATLEAVGGKVIFIPDLAGQTNTPQFSFVRDPVVILTDENLMLCTKDNFDYGAMDILVQGRKMGFTAEKINHAYIEGGNVFYSSKRKVLLHGMHPTGHYLSDYSDYDYKIEPIQTNEALSRKLSSRGIEVVGLALNPFIRSNPRLHNAYYHLDCFMQLLPDGRAVILNSNILSEASQDKMYEIFDEDFIDLAYSGYDPVLFNFISIQINNQTSVLASNLPACIVESLQDLGLIVITSCMLDPTSLTYHKELAEQVAFILQKDGFEKVTADNLITRIPQNINGYPIDDGTVLPPDERDKAYVVSSTGEISSLDMSFSDDFQENGFNYGVGGPHCLTTDLAANSSMLKNQASNLPKELEMVRDLEYKKELLHQLNLGDGAADPLANISIEQKTPSVNSLAKPVNKLNLGLFVKADKIKPIGKSKKSITCSLM